ncbi:condensation domain-containing protein [Citrobacter amalonaticus]|uniref:condensation domain-containing protein n=1 Tax=Citrobacter amalonaticus TaxID=35703 RepID=UPI00300BFEB4
MSKETAGESFLRALGPLETYAWLIDPISPKHFTVTAEVVGATSVDAWAAAFHAVQARHPLINARVNTDRSQPLHFVYDSSAKIPLRVVRLDKITDIEQEIKREFSAPFGIGDIPLLRAALLYSDTRCIIIITSHHSIADGLSLTHFIRDVLDSLAGKVLVNLSLQPTVEDICIKADTPVASINMPTGTQTPVPYTERSLAKLNVFRRRLSTELSSGIRLRAKKENTTVHGALSAAFALAFAHTSPLTDSNNPIRICTPIDARKFFALDYGLSFSVLFPTYGYDVRPTTKFWNLARAVTDDLQPIRTQQGMATFINHFQTFMNNPELNEIINFDKQSCAPDILISNLGVLPFSSRFGELTLESVWGPNVLIGTEGEQTIGVATLHDTIHLIHTSYKPLPEFLNTAEKILISSLEENSLL